MEFGIVAALAILVAGAWFKTEVAGWAIGVLLAALLAPKLFTPFTWGWFKLGEGLGKVVSGCVLFLTFFLIVTPVGCARRLMGKDPLRLKLFGKGFDSVFIPSRKTYCGKDLEKQY